MTEMIQRLCDLVEAQNEMIRQLILLLAQHQAVDQYERELEQRDKEHSALMCGQEEGENEWTP